MKNYIMYSFQFDIQMCKSATQKKILGRISEVLFSIMHFQKRAMKYHQQVKYHLDIRPNI